jgi:protein-S-isoprenylcysteine O-methyltransferase Ste14
MLPERRSRPPVESAFVRVVATCGVVAIGVALGAILNSQNVAGWIMGLVVALVSVILSAILWSSRRL